MFSMAYPEGGPATAAPKPVIQFLKYVVHNYTAISSYISYFIVYVSV